MRKAVTPKQIIEDMERPMEAPALLAQLEHYWPVIKAALLAYKPRKRV
jgi:hypothetical protein